MQSSKKERDRQLRGFGYTDGRAGRPARFKDAAYQVAWRRGREDRESAAKQ